jgi:hypothetical protein
MAWERVKILREKLGEDAPSLMNVTYKQLAMSRQMCKTILDYNSIHFLVAPSPKGSFKRQYENDREEKISAD